MEENDTHNQKEEQCKNCDCVYPMQHSRCDCSCHDNEVKEEQKALTLSEINQSIETLFFCVHLNAVSGEPFKEYFEREKILQRVTELFQSKLAYIQKNIEKRISEVDVPHGVQQRPLGRIEGLKEAIEIIKNQNL